ncbi:MAG: hypothetical protein A3B86_04255 [Candidatus Yanofskybacteria bacterium RIFCSPHIGHO2_02_FULL_38_22b]|uniref:Uncharacterized protein n=1 Tax=Candidatus Yanofskybacteria bacterium RIFCSPHIGHO2_02_FULL_38_22b TaxID=1802673 RepID=A0A1F8EZJ7_9BACT|nr:MAG: hypothetical protein A2816_02025 [Candidatus Yanofskybacteria bacterium RIFCSPHIGHO2_01_FULL_39_44]OGN06302.1 MAG: hypothetical protein A3B86_04255 [Candidatus Yanofskybacteria bacterium RIFCSPHIGHO2_02_FULL_38_22b]OGN19721.1 MAG: hypothetical protein A2910_03990 [Candidatus Yanofskybacteria bacterium RIFCSPLOWO2_01_FULL_39_28]
MKHGLENTLEHAPTEPVSASQRFLLFIENLRNIQGVLKSEEYESSGNSGEIKVDTDPNHRKLMLVKTDTGALVNADRELAIERLSACVALFVQGPGVNFLVHLTPSTDLGYYYHRFPNAEEIVRAKVQKILEPLAQAVELSSCHGLIVPNDGNNNGGPYDKSNVSQAWTRLKDILVEAGLGNVVLSEPLPLDETTLYYNPQESGTLFAAGLDVNSEDSNSTQQHKKQIRISIQSGKFAS